MADTSSEKVDYPQNAIVKATVDRLNEMLAENYLDAEFYYFTKESDTAIVGAMGFRFNAGLYDISYSTDDPPPLTVEKLIKHIQGQMENIKEEFNDLKLEAK